MAAVMQERWETETCDGGFNQNAYAVAATQGVSTAHRHSYTWSCLKQYLGRSFQSPLKSRLLVRAQSLPLQFRNAFHRAIQVRFVHRQPLRLEDGIDRQVGARHSLQVRQSGPPTPFMSASHAGPRPAYSAPPPFARLVELLFLHHLSAPNNCERVQ